MKCKKNWNFIKKIKQLKELYGNNTALTDRYNHYSYSDIYYFSGKIASFINNKLNSFENCIGVIADNSAQSVMLMLGVMCSGNFYLPIDPYLPKGQWNTIINNSEMKILFLPDRKYEKFVDYDCYSFEDIVELCSEGRFFADVQYNTPLYAVLTSGSTGMPKIILKTHKAMMVFISSFADTFSVSDKDKIGNQTPFYSDAAQKDLFLMLYLGARLILIPQFLFTVPYALVRYMNEVGITYISWVPSAYDMVARFDIFRKEQLTGLKYSFWVGERIHKRILAYWKSYLTETEFYNIYGMSEIAGVCTYYNMNKENADIIPIGIPFKHCRLALLSETNQLSNAGELLVWTEALALCVLTDKGKKSLDQISITIDGENVLFYKTGDYGYLNADYQYVITGRRDEQIKLRGYRIELQEIERVLQNYDFVSDVAVVFYEGKIIAFIALSENDDAVKEDLIKYVKSNLFRYAIPHRYVYLDHIPYNRNGKRDKVYLQFLLQNEV